MRVVGGGTSLHHGDGGVVVVGKIILRVQFDGPGIPILRFLQMSLTKFQETHCFVGGNIVGIVLQRLIEQRFGVGETLVVREKVGAQGVSLRRGQSPHFES